MDNQRVKELREALETENISLSELAEIEAVFAEIPDDQLRDLRENAMAGDMLDEIETFNEEEEEKITEDEALEKYNEYLNEVYGVVNIAGLEYDTAQALEELDPTAYRTGFNDWTDAEGIEIKY